MFTVHSVCKLNTEYDSPIQYDNTVGVHFYLFEVDWVINKHRLQNDIICNHSMSGTHSDNQISQCIMSHLPMLIPEDNDVWFQRNFLSFYFSEQTEFEVRV